VVTPAARRAAWLIALAADAIQIVFFPMFAGGAVSFLNDGLDLVVAFVLTMLLGWHIAFLPALVTELIPGVDLVPTWTAAVFFATRGMRTSDPAPPGAPSPPSP
jgi:hypothetical protein